jgi:hypothetical protein
VGEPKLRWVRRNEDKPHRCPECHAVATWDRESAGPRTVLRCPHGCGQWRYGRRCHREPMRYRPAVRVIYRGRTGLLPRIITVWQGGRR